MNSQDNLSNYVEAPAFYCAGLVCSGAVLVPLCMVVAGKTDAPALLGFLGIVCIMCFAILFLAPLATLPFLLWWVFRHWISDKPYLRTEKRRPLLCGAVFMVYLCGLGFIPGEMVRDSLALCLLASVAILPCALAEALFRISLAEDAKKANRSS